MKKFFILMLSATLCGANPVFAMDPPEGDKYTEAYRTLPKIQLETIRHPLDVKNLLALQKLLTHKGSRFQTQDGQVYEINRKEFPALCYLAGEYMPYSSGRADLRRINEMTFVDLQEEGTTISHTYGSFKFGPKMVNFTKVNLQEYVQVDWNKNLSSSEIALFKALGERRSAPVTRAPQQDTSEQNIPEQDDLLGPWEDLGSSFPPQELPHEDLLSAKIFSESIVLDPKPSTGIWKWWTSTS